MKNSKKALSCFLLITWLLIIFLFSNTLGDKSDEQSKLIVEQIVKAPSSEKNDIEETNKNSNNIEEKANLNIEYLNYIVRKVAHMGEYFILALLVLNVIYQFKNDRKISDYIICVSFCFVYAITDEVHQLFVAGRTGQFSDVLIDTLGASIACFVIMLIKWIKLRKSKV